MELEEFRVRGRQMLDYIASYFDGISERRVSPDVRPGFLKSILPETAPNKAEPFEKIMEDIENLLMPGVVHWQHPNFHAHVPAASSYNNILGEMMIDVIACAGLNWNAGPFESELEIVVTNWLGKEIGLPETFLRSDGSSEGGGILLSTADESMLACLVAARREALDRIWAKRPSLSYSQLLSSLVAYCSNDVPQTTENLVILSLIEMRTLNTDKDRRLRGDTLAEAIREDKSIGLIPFFVCATIGTNSGASDAIDEIGPICEANGLWLAVSASYAGTALMCPEYKYLLKGMEYATSFNMSPSTWMLVNLNCDALFVKDRSKIDRYVMVNTDKVGYRILAEDWNFTTVRGGLAVKLWFVMRGYGVEGLQKHVQNHVRLAKMFEDMVKSDERFEVLSCNFGVVCFRLKHFLDKMNKKLVKAINSSGKLLLTAYYQDQWVIRFILCIERANEQDVITAWNIISEYATELLRDLQNAEPETSDRSVEAETIIVRLPPP